MAVRKRSHIAVEFFYRYFGPAGRHRLALSVDLSKSLIYWAACLGRVGMTVYAARNFVHRVRSPPSDEDLPPQPAGRLRPRPGCC